MPTLLAWIAVGFFVVAAIIGATLLQGFIRRKNIPKGVALIHGFFAACGVGLLAAGLLLDTDPETLELGLRAKIALGLFALAALGGVTMFLVWHRKGKRPPIPLAIGHAAAAVSGLIVLLTVVLFP